MRETLDQDVGGAIAHFFNCLVGPRSAEPVVEESTGSSEKTDTKPTAVSDYTVAYTFLVGPVLIFDIFTNYGSCL